MYDLRRRNSSARASSNKRPSRQTLHVRFLVKLRTELDVPIGGFASSQTLEFGCSLILIRPRIDDGSGPSGVRGAGLKIRCTRAGGFRVGIPVL